jgi:hypothetical protein
LVQDVKKKFGHVKDSNIVHPPDINNEPFHPNYVEPKDMTPEDLFDQVEALEFPGNLVSTLRNQFMLDLNTAYFWIHEYRKFLLLFALFRDVVPSTRILHVWQTHLVLNTANFRQCIWKIHCEDVLYKIPFYSSEDYTGYSSTLACYKIIFNEEAPEIMWEQPA